MTSKTTKKLYYIKFLNGEEIITELYMVTKNNEMQYQLFRPMSIRLTSIGGPEPSIIAVPFVDPTYTSEFVYEFDMKNVLLFSDKVSDNMYAIYNGYIDYLEDAVKVNSKSLEAFYDAINDEFDEEDEDEDMEIPDHRILH